MNELVLDEEGVPVGPDGVYPLSMMVASLLSWSEFMEALFRYFDNFSESLSNIRSVMDDGVDCE